MLFKIQNLGWLCLAFTMLEGGLNAQPSDLVLRNAKVITMEPSNPQARALAARGGRIVAIGTNQQIQTIRRTVD